MDAWRIHLESVQCKAGLEPVKPVASGASEPVCRAPVGLKLISRFFWPCCIAKYRSADSRDHTGCPFAEGWPVNLHCVWKLLVHPDSGSSLCSCWMQQVIHKCAHNSFSKRTEGKRKHTHIHKKTWRRTVTFSLSLSCTHTCAHMHACMYTCMHAHTEKNEHLDRGTLCDVGDRNLCHTLNLEIKCNRSMKRHILHSSPSELANWCSAHWNYTPTGTGLSFVRISSLHTLELHPNRH